MKIGNISGFCLTITLFLLISGCSTMEVMRDDPLIGKIYTAKDQTELSYAELLQRMADKDIIYLGENHDNPEHHKIQMQIINDLVKQGKRPRIGFEFFSRDQTGYLMLYVGARHKPQQETKRKVEESRLRRELGWQDKTDELWTFYFNLIALAREHQLEVFGADLPKGVITRIMRQGADKLTAVEKSILHSTNLKDPEYRALMSAKFKAAHCGFAHKGMTDKMYRTWLERNDAMAASISETVADDPEQPIVMIVGSGHLEHNMGIVERVANRNQSLKQLNLSFREIAIESVPLGDYFVTEKIGPRTFPPRHELLWFTQRTSYQDPCEKFHKVLKRMKQKKTLKQPPP